LAPHKIAVRHLFQMTIEVIITNMYSAGQYFLQWTVGIIILQKVLKEQNQ